MRCSTLRRYAERFSKLVWFPSALALMCFMGSLAADVTVNPLFQDHAVLQQERNVPVWGKGSPNEAITVSFRGQKLTTTAGADGKWRVDLKPMKFSAEPAELVIQGANTLTIKDVLVGEVWLCSGQSNMEMGVAASQDGSQAVAEAKLPVIRQFKVGKSGKQEPVDTVNGKWVVCDPSTAGAFTAVGFYFARQLNKELGIPVGILQSAVSGSQIEPWVSEKTLRTNPKLAPALDRYTTALAAFPEASAKFQAAMTEWEKKQADAQKEGTPFKDPKPGPPMGPGHDNFPLAFYNGMIHPLIPYAIRGALWYQGESNTGRVDEYRDVFPAMITQWREEWMEGDFPFYFVQLPVYGDYPSSWSGFREAQAAALKLPNTGMAVTIDISSQDLHPKNKLDVGLRLAQIAKAQVYKIPGTEYCGPQYQKSDKEGAAMRLSFEHAAGMAPRGDKLIGFELAGADKKYVPANAVIESNGTILVSSDKIAEPVFVRYAWAVPGANLYNAAGLPAVPFRTDAPQM